MWIIGPFTGHSEFRDESESTDGRTDRQTQVLNTSQLGSKVLKINLVTLQLKVNLFLLILSNQLEKCLWIGSVWLSVRSHASLDSDCAAMDYRGYWGYWKWIRKIENRAQKWLSQRHFRRNTSQFNEDLQVIIKSIHIKLDSILCTYRFIYYLFFIHLSMIL